jgi:hypothetical protein
MDIHGLPGRIRIHENGQDSILLLLSITLGGRQNQKQQQRTPSKGKQPPSTLLE